MMNELISIIVPIYKTEPYLERCLESIVNQTYENLEIVLVDDGSPDECPRMCDEWAAKDPRIKVIHKQNEGLGEARNTGMENATGDYVSFVDSDDYIGLDLVEKAYSTAKEHDSEVVIFGNVRSEPEKNRFAFESINSLKKTYRDDEVQKVFLPELIGENPETGHRSRIPNGVCACLFSAALIKRHNWKFVSEKTIISEDLYSLMGLYKSVNSVTILNEGLYYYCLNADSLTQKYRPDRYEKIKYFYDACIELCRMNGYSSDVERRCMEPFLSFTISALKLEESSNRPLVEKMRAVKRIITDERLQKILQEKRFDKTSLKKRLLYWAIRKKNVLGTYLFLVLQNRLQK